MSGEQHQMISLVPATAGAMTLPAPHGRVAVTDGLHGRLWQWIGDGRELISLTVAVRHDVRLLTARGVADHLTWELRRLDEVAPLERDDAVDVPGAAHAARGRIRCLREGVHTLNEVLVALVGADMYVVHAMVTDSGPGRDLVDRVFPEIRC